MKLNMAQKEILSLKTGTMNVCQIFFRLLLCGRFFSYISVLITNEIVVFSTKIVCANYKFYFEYIYWKFFNSLVYMFVIHVM